MNAYILWKQWKPADINLRMKEGYSMLDFRTDLAIQLAELDHVDETFTVPLPFGGMTLDAVLKTLTERAQAECLQKGEDALYCQVNVQLKGGIDPLQWRKEPRPHLPVFSGNSSKRLNCRVCWEVSKAVTGKGIQRKIEVVCSGCGSVLRVVFHCVSCLVIPKTFVTAFQFFIH